MKHFLSLKDLSKHELAQIVARAWALKNGAPTQTFAGKILALLFFNQSLRTRLSFEAAMARFGGTAISITPGSESWGIELIPGAVMNGSKPEHVKDAARVISRYAQAIGVRSFAALESLEADAADETLAAFAEHATVPVINMESAMEHPCQGLADMLTIQERFRNPQGKNFVLSWAPHIKPLPLAVSHSAVLAAARLGMNVTIAHPQGYDLQPAILDAASSFCAAAGSTLSVTNDQQSIPAADVVYVKSWGAPALYGKAEEQSADFARNAAWLLKADSLSANAILMHCLPVRRNVEVRDEVLDSPQSVIIDQAENRLWAQSAVLELLLTARSERRTKPSETIAA